MKIYIVDSLQKKGKVDNNSNKKYKPMYIALNLFSVQKRHYNFLDINLTFIPEPMILNKTVLKST